MGSIYECETCGDVAMSYLAGIAPSGELPQGTFAEVIMETRKITSDKNVQPQWRQRDHLLLWVLIQAVGCIFASAAIFALSR